MEPGLQPGLFTPVPGFLSTQTPLASLPLGQHSSRPVFLKLTSGLVSVLLKTHTHTHTQTQPVLSCLPASARAVPSASALPACLPAIVFLPKLTPQVHFCVQPSVRVRAPPSSSSLEQLWLLPSQHPGHSLLHLVVYPQIVSFLKARSGRYLF